MGGGWGRKRLSWQYASGASIVSFSIDTSSLMQCAIEELHSNREYIPGEGRSETAVVHNAAAVTHMKLYFYH